MNSVQLYVSYKQKRLYFNKPSINKTHSTNCDEGDASDGPKGQKALSAAAASLKRVWRMWCKCIRQGAA